MRWGNRVVIIVPDQYHALASSIWQALDPDVGGEFTFGRGVSATGVDPATHHLASTPLPTDPVDFDGLMRAAKLNPEATEADQAAMVGLIVGAAAQAGVQLDGQAIAAGMGSVVVAETLGVLAANGWQLIEPPFE